VTLGGVGGETGNLGKPLGWRDRDDTDDTVLIFT